MTYCRLHGGVHIMAISAISVFGMMAFTFCRQRRKEFPRVERHQIGEEWGRNGQPARTPYPILLARGPRLSCVYQRHSVVVDIKGK